MLTVFNLILNSHTAIEAPERCVFGQMVNIGAVMCKWCFVFGQMVNIGAVMCK